MPAGCKASTISLNSRTWPPGSLLDGIAAMRREERQRVVAPVVRSAAAVAPDSRGWETRSTGINSTAVTPSDCR